MATGSCLMEYVSIFAGEPFDDLPDCTHPAVAAVAWRVNDEVSPATRQQLVSRAPALTGAGRGLDRPVRPVVLGIITEAALALDPRSRYFQRLRRRLDDAGSAGNPCAADRAEGRWAVWCQHVVPVSVAMTRLFMIIYESCPDRDQRDQLAVAVLDDCLVALRPDTVNPAPNLPDCLLNGA